MTCAADRPTFRLLDPIGGWDIGAVHQVVETSARLELAARRPRLSAVTPGEVAHCLLPSNLAHNGGGRWYLVADGRVLGLGPCDAAFAPLAGPVAAIDAAAVAASGPVLAVVDATSRSLLVLDGHGHRVIARHRLSWPGPGPSAVGLVTGERMADTVLVAGPGPAPDRGAVVAFDLTGRELQRWVIVTGDEIVAVGVLDSGGPSDRGPCRPQLVAVTAVENGAWREVWPLPDPVPGTTPTVAAPLCAACLDPCDPTTCVTFVEGGMCLGPAGSVRCFDHHGRQLATPDGEPPRPIAVGPPRQREGWLETGPLDGGHDHARWRRVSVDAMVPLGTTVDLQVCVVSDATDVPAAGDWERIGQLDALIQRQPPGRYLRTRLRLAGDGAETPLVRGIRFDIDPDSTAATLPAVYLEDPPAADFTERFTALFDAVVDELAGAVGAASALFDPEQLRDELLPVLLDALGLPDDPTWRPGQRRRLLARAAELTAALGTARGLVAAVETVYGVTVHVEERGADRPWGVTGRAHLGRLRLQARSRAAARLDTSALGAAPIDAFADPGAGAFSRGAHQVVVTVPWLGAPARPDHRRALEALVRRLAPAHIELTVQFAPGQFLLGGPLRLGIGTSLRGLPPGVLGGSGPHAVRLGRATVVAASGRHAGRPIALGTRSSLGLNTTVG